jgi:hypothetical protein
MIVQITMTRNELFLIKEMLPQWQKYADGFVFMCDRCTDGTYEYLTENKDKYNILEILTTDFKDGDLDVETDVRQKLYDAAHKHSEKIICLDTDEYVDGEMTKSDLETVLEQNKNCVFKTLWIQYTSKDTIRVDGPWRVNFHERIGCYEKRGVFKEAFSHSEHVPSSDHSFTFGFPDLFIAHLQWLDKKTVGVKQYYWKISDYVANREHGASVISPECYDHSVNNFDWEYANIHIPLKVDEKVYEKDDLQNGYKYKFIKESVEKYGIPNMNDWGMGIHSGELFK